MDGVFLDGRRRTTTEVGLLVLRLGIGAVLIAHGAQKLFETTVPGVGAWFGQLGVPMPEFAAVAVALIEFVGGIAIVLGIASRLSSLLAAITMVGAIVLVHAGAGFFAADGGIELPLVLAVGAVAIVIAGPGRYSVAGLVLPRSAATYAS